VPDLLLDPRVRSALGESRQAFVAVASRHGPHVTPELYASEGGRLWFASAASTLKVKVLAHRPQAAAVVRAGDRSVVVAGRVESFDPLDPRSVASAARQGPTVAKALAQFGLRNAPDLAGFVADTVRGRLGSRIPTRRTLLALKPDRVAVVRGADLEGAWGDWPGEPIPATETYEGLAAVVGWETDAGVLALPARWDPSTWSASVPSALAGLAQMPEAARACVVADDYGGPGPAAKSGILLRGEATRAGNVVHMDADRVTAWVGTATATEPAS
jgi:hypothetical protein